jgi:hypothetical protein
VEVESLVIVELGIVESLDTVDILASVAGLDIAESLATAVLASLATADLVFLDTVVILASVVILELADGLDIAESLATVEAE